MTPGPFTSSAILAALDASRSPQIQACIHSAARTKGGRVTAAFTEQFSQFKEQSRLDGRFEPKQTDWFPFLNDNTSETGFDPHYVLHTSWAARSLAKTKPEGSRQLWRFSVFCRDRFRFYVNDFLRHQKIRTAVPRHRRRRRRLNQSAGIMDRHAAIHLLYACFRAYWAGAIWRRT